MAWRDIGGAPDEALEELRQRLLTETRCPVTGRCDWSAWPRDVLAFHIRRREAECPFLRGGTRGPAAGA